MIIFFTLITQQLAKNSWVHYVVSEDSDNTVRMNELIGVFVGNWRSSHYAVTHVRNKNSDIQVRSHNVMRKCKKMDI